MRSVSIELESPVVVVPRSAHSTQVVVAHLGTMSLCNRPGPPRHTLYRVRVRDISLVTVTLYSIPVLIPIPIHVPLPVRIPVPVPIPIPVPIITPVPIPVPILIHSDTITSINIHVHTHTYVQYLPTPSLLRVYLLQSYYKKPAGTADVDLPFPVVNNWSIASRIASARSWTWRRS